MENTFILYLSGGATSAMYGAGVATGIRDHNLLPHLQGVHGGSAGLTNGAYLLSGQAELGTSIYTENLQEGFIYPKQLIRGPYQLYRHRVLPESQRRHLQPAVDIDHVIGVMQEEKPLEISRLQSQPIPLYAKLLDADTGDIVHKDIRTLEDPLAGLKAAISIVPYYPFSQEIDGSRYIDGTIKEPIGLEYLLEEYPEDNIAVAANGSGQLTMSHQIKSWLEGTVAQWTYDIPLKDYYLQRYQHLLEDMQLAQETDRVLLLHPSAEDSVPPRELDPEALNGAFQAGWEAAAQIHNFLEQRTDNI